MADTDKASLTIIGNDIGIAEVYASGHREGIEDAELPSDYSTDRNLADAHLIAAAPTMLEALKALSAFAARLTDGVYRDASQHLAEQAIAQAEGA